MLYERILFLLFLVLLCWVPLPYGSNSVLGMGVIGFFSFFLSAFFVIGFLLKKVKIAEVFYRAKWFHCCFMVVLLWIFVQQIPLPSSIVNCISPTVYEIKMASFKIIGYQCPEWLQLSLDSYATALNASLSLSYYLLFCLMLLLVNTPDRLRYFAWTLICAGAFQALFGALSMLSGMEVLLFGVKEHGIGLATGTFINRNHFAGFLELTLALGIGLLISQLRESKAHSWRDYLIGFLKVLMSHKVILRSIIAFMVIGLVLSRSRMGNSAFFISLVSGIAVYIICRQKLTKGIVLLFTSMIVVDLVIISQWFGIEKLVERIESTSVESEPRAAVNGVLIEMVPDFIFMGAGSGSFYTALPKYHNGSWSGFFDYAHNDFLQFPIELGVPVCFFLVAIVLMSSWHSIHAIKLNRSKLNIGMGLASFIGVFAIMIHSSVEFNLQIPSNAVYFVCMIALSIIARHMPSRKKLKS